MGAVKDINDVVKAGGRFSGRGVPVGQGAPPRRQITAAVHGLVLEKRCQVRVAANQETVTEYARLYTEGAELPPVDAVEVDGKFVVVDGFHRVAAAVQAGRSFLEVAVVGRGTLEDAALAALGANRAHGLARSNADKRRAVMLALEHPKLANESDRRIAEIVGVTHPLVAAVRSDLERGWVDEPEDAAAKGPDEARPKRSSARKALTPNDRPWRDAAKAVRSARLEVIRAARAGNSTQLLQWAIDELGRLEAGITRKTPVSCPRCREAAASTCQACRGAGVVDRARAEQILGLMQRESP